MPGTVASNISKAVFDLLREEEEVAEEFGSNNFSGTRSLPRTDQESLPERKFRICVALQICSLVRGYNECIFSMAGSHPVFNRDKFLRVAPALVEDRRGNIPSGGGPGIAPRPQTQSPRAKRFLSCLTNCQHFYQFLETLDHDECEFFREVMYTFDMSNDDRNADDPNSNVMAYGSTKLKEAINHLSKTLQKVEDKIPTYGVDRKGGKKRRGGGWDDEDDDDGLLEDLIDSHENEHDIGFSDDGNLISSFTNDLLQVPPTPGQSPNADAGGKGTVDGDSSTLQAQYAAQVQNENVWQYKKLFDIPEDGKPPAASNEKPVFKIRDKVKLRDAIGERRYRAWKLAQQEKNVATDTTSRMLTGDLASAEGNTALDLTSLLTHATEETASDTSDSTVFASQAAATTTAAAATTPLVSSLSPEQQRVADAKDRDILRRCLQKAYDGGSNQRRPARFGRSSSGATAQTTADSFFENGRDLVADAEASLRNPSAQKFLVTVLSQRSQLENQRRRRGGNGSGGGEKGRRGGGQGSISRLEPPAFECLARLCCAMLDACLEAKNYVSGYDLLTQTQGFCTVQSKDGKPLSRKDTDLDQAAQVVHMAARIALHPIFAELELWEHVLNKHLEEREDQTDNESKASGPKDADSEAFETTKSTVYEMFGFGIPSEELARFATRISEKRGWFASDRGHNLLMYARRVSAKRDNGDDGTGNAGDLDMIRAGKRRSQGSFASSLAPVSGGGGAGIVEDDTNGEWQMIGWCHPAAATQSRPTQRPDHILNMIGDNGVTKDDDPDKYLKRSAVTSLAAFGSSIVASGGLDGSVFVAHTIKSVEDSTEDENVVRGVRLDWGGSGSSGSGGYGVGAVSVLSAAKGAGYRHSNLQSGSSGHHRTGTKDVVGRPDDDDIAASMDGCRVVAGTTGGDLRVWSVRDVYKATTTARRGEQRGADERRTTHGENGASSSYPRNSRGSITEIAAGQAFSRLKFSLRGRQLSGHKGGVSCADVPSHIYRPDALVTGGADGLIKLWSLRAPSGRRASGDLNSQLFNANSLVPGGATDMRTTGRAGDAQSILTGHTGRVLCVKTAWHGDRLLSGGSDQTVRIWDLSGGSSTGRCLHTLSGHLGWVTEVHYWGPNTVVSASTDRAIALWDARVRRSPIFVLRYHKSPISDLLVGSRTDPLMVSAGADGTVATWDFRTLSGANGNGVEPMSQTPVETNTAAAVTATASAATNDPASTEKGKVQCKAIRTPAATMSHCAEGKRTKQSGPVLLSRGPGKHSRTVLSVGIDAVAKEWDMVSGNMRRSEATGHCDVVSCLHSFADGTMGGAVGGADGSSANFGGIITSSWDGTIRMRKLIRR